VVAGQALGEVIAAQLRSRGYSEFVAAMTIRFVFLRPRLASGVRGLLVC